MQSPEAEMVSRVLGIKDFLVLLGGSVVGQFIGAVDTLGAVNIAIGIPVGAIGSTKYVKPLWAKEFLMGFGIGMTLSGMNQVVEPIGEYIDTELSNRGYTTIRKSIKDAIAGIGATTGVTYESGVTLEGTGYEF